MIYREARPPRLGPAEIFKFHLARWDEDGKQIGDLVQPEGGTSIIVIKKK